MTARRYVSITVLGLGVAALLATSTVSAQRGGGGGGGFGGGGTKARMDALTENFKLEKEQRKNIKAAIDEAYKNTIPIRADLTKARTALVAAVTSGKPQADVDEAAKAYGTQAAALAGAEMKALAQLMGMLTEEQMKMQPAINAAFSLLRGAFIDDKKWDDIPDVMEGY